MINHLKFNRKILIAVFAIFIVIPTHVFAKGVCTIIDRNLNKSTRVDSQVKNLQNFLYANGYLSSKPTGLYGNLTVNAVKKFQKSKGISAAGSVGPSTRSMIKKISCISSTKDNTNVESIVTTSTTNTSSIPSSINSITLPSSDLSLTIGQTYQIEWTGDSSSGSVLNIMLEDTNGSGAGYITTNISNINHLIWTVGKVYLSNGDLTTVPPGKYRIRIIDQLSSKSSLNIKGDIFNIKEEPLSINNILPSTVIANGKTEVILYGNGFNNLTKVKLEGLSNVSFYPQYFSPEGKLIWFYVPSNVYAGNYKIYVYNDYSSVNSYMESIMSNFVDLQINK